MTPATFDIVRSARARRTRLAVDPASGRVRLVVPRRVPVKSAVAWADQHAEWIAAQRARLPAARPFAPGAVIPLDGADVTLRWDVEGARRVVREADALVCGGPVAGFSGRIARWLRAEALRVLTEETLICAAHAGVSIARVGVGDPRARWGSCTADGSIRYSWRLILAPPFVRRSTVAHEVAHRRHMNHSPAFHATVRSIYDGDPAAARAWLRAHGAELHWFGRDPS